MTYCLHPTCPKPQNSADAKFCKACGRNLLLGDRYRPMELSRHDGDRRTFIAIDERKPSQPKCAIQQFLLPGSPSAAKSSSAGSREQMTALIRQQAVQLDMLGKHPQIPQLLAFFPQDEYPCWVKEFIDGKNLARELVENGPFNESQIRSLLNELLRVLQFAHSKELIHQDVNPENIIRPKADGPLVLIGFVTDKLTTGTAVSYSEYVAPEQVKGQPVFASDIYSLGVTCIHLLTGKRPRQLYDKNEHAWVWRNDLENRKISPQLGMLLDRAIARKLPNRYQSISEVLQDVKQLPKFLYFDLDSLDLERKRFLAKQALSSVIPGKDMLFRSDAESMSGEEITDKIYEKFRTFTESELGQKRVTEEEILSLWSKYAREIVKKMPVSLEWQANQKSAIAELTNLKAVRDEERKEKLEAIAKNILLLLFETMTPKEKAQFVEKVLEEVNKHNVTLESGQLTETQIEDMLKGASISTSLTIPIVSKIILERLAQGFLIPTLDFLGIQTVRNVGILAGPIGWGVVILATLGGGVAAVSKYRKERKKVLFIQILFCLYSYRIKLT